MAYGIPVVHNILQAQQRATDASSEMTRGVRAVILVPTRELCDQVRDQIQNLLGFCGTNIRVVSIPGDVSISRAAQVPILRELPEIVVSTPQRLVEHLEGGSLVLRESLQMLVVDEADLVLSYGYEEELAKIVKELPRVRQTILMSATLTPEVEGLEKSLVLNKPKTIKV